MVKYAVYGIPSMFMTLGAIDFLMDATVDFFLDVLVAVPFPLTVVSVHIERGMH